MKKLTTEEFVKRAKEIHGDKYDYFLVDYKDARTKVKIICPLHGAFEQMPGDHINNHGCYYCGVLKKSSTTEEFIERAKEIHGNKYDYSLVIYKNKYTKVKIICPIHGVFEQAPQVHIVSKCGCKKCMAFTNEEFIERAKEIHGNKYDYSLVEYKRSNLKVKIICPIHGIFEQVPSNHVYFGNGCPKCKASHGENGIRKILLENNISFEEQKTFNECKNIHKLRFDFYLPEYNLCIEYQGRQHFEPYSFGEKSLEKFNNQKKNDEIKRNYCISKGIKLLEIKYDEDINVKLIKGVIDEYIKRIY